MCHTPYYKIAQSFPVSERFLNNCRVVSASLMEVNLIKVKLLVKRILFNKVKLTDKLTQHADLHVFIFSCLIFLLAVARKKAG